MNGIIKRIMFLFISYCFASSSFGQDEREQAFEDLYSMAQFTHEILDNVRTMPARESLDVIDNALDTLRVHRIGGLLPSLLYFTKIEKAIEVKDTTNVLISLCAFRDYAYISVSKELMRSFNYGFGDIKPMDNSWIGEGYLGVNLYRHQALMACCAFPETETSQFGVEAIIHSNGLRLFADNSYKYARQILAIPEVDSLYQQIVSLQHKYKKWEGVTPMNSPTLQYDFTICDYPERKALKDSIEDCKQNYISKIYKDNTLLLRLFTSWIDVKNKLNDNDKAIVFAKIQHDTMGNNQYIAFVIGNTYEQPKVIRVCEESQLIEWEKDKYYDIQRLQDIVWSPLKDEILESSKIYFSTDGLLHKLPIENALISCPAVRLSSLRFLSQCPTKNKIRQAALFGGLSYSNDTAEMPTENQTISMMQTDSHKAANQDVRYGVHDLAFTKSEVKTISTILQQHGINVTTFIGEDGTEEAFQSLTCQNIDIVHLATHGFFWSQEMAEELKYVSFLAAEDLGIDSGSDSSMIRSGLFFSGANVSLAGEQYPGDVEDGVLTAKELSSLDFGDIELVVMSACDTGLGEVNNEGVFGLQRGFKLAGAQSLLMSLWKVDDEATKELMTEFYRNLLDEKSKSESLRLAQEFVKSQPRWEAPKYWAGFILLDALD